MSSVPHTGSPFGVDLTTPHAAQHIQPQNLTPKALNPISLIWVLKRAALGVIILSLGLGLIAWLTYASIEPSQTAVLPQNI